MIDVNNRVEYFVCMGRRYGSTKSDRLIDVMIHFILPDIYEWVQTVWVQQCRLAKYLSTYGSYGDSSTWTHLRTNFIG
jgi:hypothetical protein